MNVNTFLFCSTPVEWLTKAVEEVPTLLIDHANCEKKSCFDCPEFDLSLRG